MQYTNQLRTVFFQTTLIASLSLLVACGGGGGKDSNGGGGTDNLPNTPVSTWVKGEYKTGIELKDQCEMPRTGNDFRGNPYSDKAGTIQDENNWLRSWSHETYLWYQDLPDLDPSQYASPTSYFKLLKSNKTTDSGNPRDKYHFSKDTFKYNQSTQSGISYGYGVSWAFISTNIPRKLRVAFIENNTPASIAGLQRGDEILTIDDIDLVTASTKSGVDILNDGIAPKTIGEDHIFTIRKNDGSITTVTLESASITSDPVLKTKTIASVNGKVGYLLFNTHNAVSEKRLAEEITKLASNNIEDLVLDLRYNGGGYLAVASQLAYMIAGKTQTTNKIFEKTNFNQKIASPAPLAFLDTTVGISTLPSGQALPVLNLSRIYVLSTGGTCSASEALINGLRGIDVEVILIGSTTCGKPYGFYPTDNCGTTYFTIQFKGVNQKGFGDYSDGFSPSSTAGSIGTSVTGCSVEDDFEHELGSEQESLLLAALNYRVYSTCPVATGVAVDDYYELQAEMDASNGLAIKKPVNLTDGKILEFPIVKNKQ